VGEKPASKGSLRARTTNSGALGSVKNEVRAFQSVKSSINDTEVESGFLPFSPRARRGCKNECAPRDSKATRISRQSSTSDVGLGRDASRVRGDRFFRAFHPQSLELGLTQSAGDEGDSVVRSVRSARKKRLRGWIEASSDGDARERRTRWG
jgi:hypothetical protein